MSFRFLCVFMVFLLSACDVFSSDSSAESKCFSAAEDLNTLFADFRARLVDPNIEDQEVYEMIEAKKPEVLGKYSIVEGCVDNDNYFSAVNRERVRLGDLLLNVFSMVERGEYVEEIDGFNNSNLLENRLDSVIRVSDNIISKSNFNVEPND